MFNFKFVASASVSLLIAAGCGGGPTDQPDLHAVSGTVTHEGKPLADMIVSFTPKEGGRPASGKTDADGSFTLLYKEGVAGAPAGTHIVRLAFVEPETQEYESGNEEENEGASALKGLPKSAFDGSLTKDVKAGSNDIKIEL